MTHLNTTAIKGFRLQNPESITLTTEGVVGDRDFLLVDETGPDPARPRFRIAPPSDVPTTAPAEWDTTTT